MPQTYSADSRRLRQPLHNPLGHSRGIHIHRHVHIRPALWQAAAIEHRYAVRQRAFRFHVAVHAFGREQLGLQAEMLGLNFRSFRYRLKKYSLGADGGLSDDEGEEELQG